MWHPLDLTNPILVFLDLFSSSIAAKGEANKVKWHTGQRNLKYDTAAKVALDCTPAARLPVSGNPGAAARVTFRLRDPKLDTPLLWA